MARLSPGEAYTCGSDKGYVYLVLSVHDKGARGEVLTLFPYTDGSMGMSVIVRSIECKVLGPKLSIEETEAAANFVQVKSRPKREVTGCFIYRPLFQEGTGRFYEDYEYANDDTAENVRHLLRFKRLLELRKTIHAPITARKEKDMQTNTQKLLKKTITPLTLCLGFTISVTVLAVVVGALVFGIKGGPHLIPLLVVPLALSALFSATVLIKHCSVWLEGSFEPTKHQIQQMQLRKISEVEMLVKRAENTADPLVMEKVCCDLKQVTATVREELSERIQVLRESIVNIRDLRVTICSSMDNMEEGTEEYSMNAQLHSDLQSNLERLEECEKKIEATSKMASHMDRYLETKIALLSASVNVVRINDLCVTYINMVDMFRNLDTHMEREGVIAETRKELLLEAHARA